MTKKETADQIIWFASWYWSDETVMKYQFLVKNSTEVAQVVHLETESACSAGLPVWPPEAVLYHLEVLYRFFCTGCKEHFCSDCLPKPDFCEIKSVPFVLLTSCLVLSLKGFSHFEEICLWSVTFSLLSPYILILSPAFSLSIFFLM